MSAPSTARIDGVASRHALAALAVAMLCGSLVYAAFTTALPKWAEIRVRDGWPQADLGIVGVAVAAVFLVGGLGQVLAGHLSDHHEPRRIYFYTMAAKPFLLVGAALMTGSIGLAVVALLILVMDVASPSESLLLARWTPTGRRGFAFGVRHAVALAAAPGGVWLAAVSHSAAWGLDGLFVGLAGLAALATFAVAVLPKEREPTRNAPTVSPPRARQSEGA